MLTLIVFGIGLIGAFVAGALVGRANPKHTNLIIDRIKAVEAKIESKIR